MAIRIRVHPQYGGMGAMGMGMGMGMGYGAYGGYGAEARIMQDKLDHERKTSKLRLSYERALWQERLKTVQLQTQLQAAPVGAYPYGAGMYGNPWASFMRPMGFTGALMGGMGMIGSSPLDTVSPGDFI